MGMTLYEAATNIDIAPVRDWKEKGKKVVGYTCSFLPIEVFYAAEILPIRLRGIGADSMEIGDAYYGPFACTFPKAVLQFAGSGKYSFLDGVVISNGCDAMRRLDDCWRKMGKDIDGTLPSWLHYFDVPHKPDGHAFIWYVNQVRKLIAAVEEQFQVTISDEKLTKTIRQLNRVRKLILDMEQLRANDPVAVSGTEAFSSLIASTIMPAENFAELLADLIQTAKKRDNSVQKGKQRIFLGGSICDSVELVSLIEDAGAVVVGENVCFGIRSENELVNEDEEPIVALTRRYLAGSACPRMFGWYKTRLKTVAERIRAANVDGVILQNIRFCDMHGTENGLMERDLEQMGIPCLRIEKEYGPLTETGRLKMRVSAFIEQLKSKNQKNETATTSKGAE
ncbi:MAG: 2-hydroxyacyl-CoA dehydratase subunit D [Thermodesulfobacteriota bacterium]